MGVKQGARYAGKTTSPLGATLERLSKAELENGIDVSARLGAPLTGGAEEQRWIPATMLAGDDAILEEVLDRLGRAYGTYHRAYVGTTLIRGYLWRLLAPAAAAFLTERRVPDPSAHNVALRFDGRGFADGLAFLSPAFAALPDDPDAGHPEAVVLPSEAELLAWTTGRLTQDHLPPLFATLRRHRLRRGTRAVRDMAVDVVAEAFMFVGKGLGRPEEGLRHGEAALSGATAHFGPTNYYVLEHDGGSGWSRVRNACCLYYKVGDGACFTCPRMTHEERLQRIAEEG
jgi:hypothetical protein